MPLYRGFFNKKDPVAPEPVEPTRRIARSEPVEKARPVTPSAPSAPTPPLPPAPPASKDPVAPEPVEPTRRIARSEPVEKASPAAPPASSAPIPPVPSAPPASPAAASPLTDPLNVRSGPVVGWLVIIAGPGRGEVLQLSYGVNDIGSGPGARVRLNFGDTTITPDNHAAIIYTTRSRRFYLAQSTASETWLNGQRVRESVELAGGETVRFGQTHMRFAPLCGPEFDWRDSD